jgi:hypothetical protein
VHSRFKEGQSGNPRRPHPKNLTAPLVDAVNEKVVAIHLPTHRQGSF